ncbi:MAG: hypothetical protein HY326_13465 [Chloroflexi bacterium]|nr:hypothetical protein [Chloroflexota bacterium]
MMDGRPNQPGSCPTEQAILQSLIYADLFDFPLTADEIHRYLPGLSVPATILRAALAENFGWRDFSHTEGYFTLPGRRDIIPIRQQRRENANRLWIKAHRYAALIAHIPYVRMVAVTGTLAVENVKTGDDIDYLIITAPGRLWLCRALVIGLVRLARLVGDELCPNYFLSERMLETRVRNLFTARELVQMVPLYGAATYAQFRLANKWTQAFFPNANASPANGLLREVNGSFKMLKQYLEKFLSGSWGDWLERWEMQRKILRLTRQAETAGVSAAPGAAIFTADCCKGHFEGYDRIILDRYRAGLQTYGLTLELQADQDGRYE